MIPAAALISALAIVGRTGSGKTYAAKTAVEGLLADGAPVCVIDPTGAWWGLRAAQDGSRSAFAPVIFGGDHADVSIDDSAGERLGALIAAGKPRASIVDLSDFTGGETTRFLTDFFEELYRANRAPLHLIMDEADVMAPQQPMPEQQRLKGAVNKIVRRGRSRGIRPMMITQRPAVIDKSVLSQISTLVAMRLTSPQDRKAIEDWVKSNADAGQAREVLDTLPRLAVGEGWVWSPDADVLERVTFPRISTFDSSRAPEEGDAIAEPSALADADLGELRMALAPEASIPVSLRKCATSQVAAADELAAAERRGYERGFADGVSTGQQQSAAMIRSAADALESTLKHLESGDVAKPFSPGERLQMLVAEAGPEARAVAKPAPQPEPKPKPERQPTEAAPNHEVSADAGLPAAAQKILSAINIDPPVFVSWRSAAMLAGSKGHGGAFNGAKKSLRASGKIVEDGDRVRIAVPTADAAPRLPPAGTMVELWEPKVSKAAGKILRHLFEIGGAASRSAIASGLGIAGHGGSWNGAWKELRTNEMVVMAGDVAELNELFRSA